MWFTHVCVLPLTWSTTFAWRWLKVPLSTSCPVIRTVCFSCSKLPIARASPVAQSTPCPLANICSFSLEAFFRLRCRVNPSGIVCRLLPTCSSVSSSRPVASCLFTVWRGTLIFCQGLSSLWVPFHRSVGISTLSDSSHASSNAATTFASIAAISAAVKLPSASSRSLYTVTGLGCFAMAWYISGCVNMGSSTSLCPCLRYPTRSMITSRWNAARYSAAMVNTRVTASQSSALTWKIGHPNAFPKSEAYRVDRPWSGLAVNPIWLLQITLMVPPVWYASSCAICMVSYTIPCPANAASP
mmetsp:Transcript_24256/g.44233  ORF Transcript_24256/g.44233 Transcript_24256/m.44233 type:complete len:299 (-) Transcript_24256:1006-1902(-)